MNFFYVFDSLKCGEDLAGKLRIDAQIRIFCEKILICDQFGACVNNGRNGVGDTQKYRRNSWDLLERFWLCVWTVMIYK